MSIQYSGNANIFTITTGPSTPSSDFETAFVAGMIASGWTNTATAASDVLTFSAQPANSSTFTLDGSPNAVTYTFVTTLSGNTAFNIVIAGTLAGTIANAVACITGGAGGGTNYGNGTGYHAHATMTATGGATTLTVNYLTSGSAGNGAPVSTSGTINATWATSTLQGGGNTLLSAITPQGLQGSVLVFTTSGSFYNPGTQLHMLPGTRDRAIVGVDMLGTGAQVIGGSTTFKVIANKYQFFSLLPSSTSSTVAGACLAFIQPFIPSSMACPQISAATNASPIVCTVTGHGFTTGQSVYIIGGLGNTNVNGTFTITVVDANNFSLNGSTGNGAYTTNTAIVSNLTIGQTLANAIVTCGPSNGAPQTWRGNFNVGGTPSATTTITNTTQANSPSFFPFIAGTGGQWFDTSYLMSEPLIFWIPSGSGSSGFIMGQVWDAVTVATNLIPLDQTTSFDTPSHNWWAYCVNLNGQSLLLATS